MNTGSEITFWRSLGGTIGTAILGSILTNRLPTAAHAGIAGFRIGLADTLHELFIVAALIATVALAASMFLREVPLTRDPEMLGEEVEAAA